MTKRFGFDGQPRIRLLCGGAAAILLGFVAIASYTVVDAWRATWKNAVQSSENLSAALAHDIDRNITLYDLSLQTVISGLTLPEISRLSPAVRDAVLFDGSATAEGFGATLVIDEYGTLQIASRSTPVSTPSYAQRDFFAVQRDHTDLGLYIGAPYRLHHSGEWAVPFSRRLNHADGSFAGIVAGSMKLSYIDRLFNSVDLGENGTVTLLRSDGIVLMRKPSSDRDIGRSVPDIDHFRASPAGNFEAAGKLDGVERLFVYQQVGNLPLIVSVAPTVRVIFAEWQRKAGITMGLMLGLVGLASWLILMLLNEFRHRAEAEQRIIASEQRHKSMAVAERDARAALERSMAEVATALQRAQAAEALLRNAVDSVTEGFVIYDADDRFVMCNAAYERLYSVLASELRPGVPFEHILRVGIARANRERSIADPEAWIAQRLDVHRHPPARPVERQLWDGRWILICERRMSDGGTASLQIDITALKDTQQALRESEQRLARAQRIAGIGDIERDLATGKVTWSDHAYAIYGLPKDRVPRWNEFIALIHPEDRERVTAVVAQMQKGAATSDFGYRIIRPDGRLRYLLRENELIRDASGKVVRVASTVQDVTELRQSQERERELHAQLQHRQKLEALGTLAGGIAHDMNNTLVPILALSKRAMVRAASGSREKTHLETIYRASEHARDLVKQILAFSRKETIEKTSIDFGLITRDALQMMRAGLPSTIKLVERIDDSLVVLGGAGQIRQVIINLVTNAAQAIGDKGGTITVRVESARESARLSVSDTGCGIDELHLPRLFDPFFTTKEAGQGTGLGLSVVHGIVTAHGGRIEVKSEPGKGAEFTVILPVMGARNAPLAVEPAA